MKKKYFFVCLFRKDRQNERRRDRNIARAAPEKQAKLRRDKDRDISEKIALGLPDSKSRSNETEFDQRLFNQSRVRFIDFLVKGGKIVYSIQS